MWAIMVASAPLLPHLLTLGEPRHWSRPRRAGDGGGGQGSTEQPALAEIGAEPGQLGRLLLGLDHLGNRADAELAAEVGHGAQDRRVALERQQAARVLAVELDI